MSNAEHRSCEPRSGRRISPFVIAGVVGLIAALVGLGLAIPRAYGATAAAGDTTLVGAIRLWHGDPAPGTTGKEGAEGVILDQGSRQVPLAIPEARAEKLAGKRVRIHGRSQRAGLVPDGAIETLPQDAGVTAAAAATTKTVALILVNFSDDPSQPWTPAQAEDVVLDADRTNPLSVRAFYAESSDGTDAITGKTLGWYTLPSGRGGCDVNAWADQARAAAQVDATAAGLDLSSPSVYSVVAFPNTPSCDWAGLGYLPGTTSWINGALDVRVVSHELGHNFGVHHASTEDCSDATGRRVPVTARVHDDCVHNEYGDPFSVMGGAEHHTHHAWHRHQLGYPVSTQTVPVTPGLDVVRTLTALEKDPSPSALRLLRIPRAGDGTFLDLELRGVATPDDDFGPTDPAVNGVTVRVGADDAVRTQSLLLDGTPATPEFGDAPVPAGASLWDPGAGARVTVVRVGGGTADVRITAEADTRPPSSVTGLVATGTAGSAALSWTPATDDHFVAGYEVRRDGVTIGTSKRPPFVDSCTTTPCTLTPGAHTYEVVAYDGAGLTGPAAGVSATVLPPYYVCNTAPYEWRDATAGGTRLTLGDDTTTAVTLPFGVTFYGAVTRQVSVSSNGFVQFSGDPAATFNNAAIPALGPPDGFVAPFWDDLDPTTRGGVWTRTIGTAPNREFVVAWVDVPRYGSTDPLTFEAVISEASGSVAFQYADVQTGNPDGDGGASATVGIEDPTGAAGTQYSFDTPALTDRSGIRCTRPVPNDWFASPTMLAGAAGHVTGTNQDATKEAGEPNHAGTTGGASVWYRFTAPSAGTLTFDTAGSTFDTVLAAYTGDSVGTLTQRAADDDSTGSLQSRIEAMPVHTGTTYTIAVDGFAGATGAIALDWAFTSSASTVGVSDCIATEAHGCVFTLTRSGATSGSVSVRTATVPGSATAADFTARSSKVTFAAGVVTKTVTVALTDDDLTEANESFTLALSDPVGTTLGVNGRGTVRDGTIVVTAPFSSTEAATIGRAASRFGAPGDGLRQGARVVRFLDVLAQPVGLASVRPAPTSSGPVTLTARYSQSEGNAMRALAARLGLTVRSFHIFGARVLEFADAATPR